MKIFPSLASANQLTLRNEILRLEESTTLHLDIEDGNFIPNITFGMKTVREVRSLCKNPLNAHLMVTRPMFWIRELADCGVSAIAVHFETVPYPLVALSQIRELGMSPGLALNFATPVSQLVPFIEDLDFVLIMTSEPDGRGQQFRPSSLERIRQVRALLPDDKEIWVDGGVGESQLPLVMAAGADGAVMGRAVFDAPDPQERVAYFSKQIVED